MSSFLQIYFGNLRGKTAIRHNCNVEKDLEVGSLVALNHPEWVGTVPQIAKVTRLPNFEDSKLVEISWLDGKREKKPLLERTLVPSKYAPTTVHVDNIILYNFELNQKARTLKKVTREELKRQYDELKNGEWKDAILHPKKRKSCTTLQKF